MNGSGKPVGSTDPQDLYVNAHSLDLAMNNPSSTWVDRLGNLRQTFAQMETLFAAAQQLRESEFEDLLERLGPNPAAVAFLAAMSATEQRQVIGLGNVNNTADSAKPISTAMQLALNDKANTSALADKANIASPAFTGAPSAPTATAGTNTTQLATTEFANAAAIPPEYTLAQLPAPTSALRRRQAYCSDMAGGFGPIYCTGTAWLRTADNSVVN